MKLISIELSYFLRLALNNIKKIHVDIVSAIHLILGSNGSGKSSLMSELSPLPANKKMYGSGGYKFSVWEHRGSRYELLNKFDGDEATYSFKKDDVELNETLKLTEFRRLVQQEFGLTQELFDLARGRLRFHNLTANELRAWFTRLSDTDYTYALQYYRRVCEKLRDISGALKQHQTRLGLEQSKLIDESQERILREHLEKTNAVLKDLLDSRDNKDYRNTANRQSVEATLTGLTTQLNTLLRKYASFEEVHFLQSDDFETQRIRYQVLHQEAADLVNKQIKVIETQNETLKNYKNIERPQSEIETMISGLGNNIKSLSGSLLIPIEIERPDEAQNQYLFATDTVNEVSRALRQNKDMTLNTDYYNKLRADAATLREKIAEELQNITQVQDILLGLMACKKQGHVKCPACDHAWYQGYDEKRYLDNSALKEKLEANVDVLNKRAKEMDEHISEVHNHLTYVTILSRLMKSSVELKPFWEYLITKQVIWRAPQTIADLWGDLKHDLQTHSEIVKAKERHRLLLEELRLKRLAEENNVDRLRKENEEANDHLATLIARSHRHRSAMIRMETILGVRSRIADVQKQLQAGVDIFNSAVESEQAALSQAYVNDIIRHIQMSVVESTQRLSRIDIQKAVVNDIQTQMAVLTQEKELLALAEKELSPKGGLIAKGLTNFINHFFTRVNDHIKESWLSHLEIVPIELDEDGSLELDYRFGLEVGEYRVHVPDLREASTGQLDIIDRAFAITAFEHMGMDDIPLYMDEYGAQMDHAHIRSACDSMIRLLNNGNYSQLFMISHHENSYMGLSGADITVLCPHNVVIPPGRTVNENTFIFTE